MRRLATMSLALLLVFAAACHASDPSEAGPRLITVNGHAEVKVVPDLVQLTLGVETVDVDINQAKAANDERVEAVLASIEEHGVERRYVQTDFLTIEPRYKDRYITSELLGYVVSKSMVVRLEDVSQFESLLSAVLEAGVNHIYGIDFQTSELRTHRDLARSLALRAAREKAEAMASELGQDVGRPHSIQEGPVRWRYGSSGAQNVIQNAGTQPVGVGGVTPGGQISIDAEVTVSFELRQAR